MSKPLMINTLMTPSWKCVVVALVLASTAAVAGEAIAPAWYQYENTHFTIYSDAPEEEVRMLIEDLENFRAAVYQFGDDRVPEGSGKTRVIIFRSEDEFARTVKNDRVRAYTVGIGELPHIVMPSGSASPWSQVTLRHEYVHVLQGYRGDHLPAWYFEGLAEFLSGVRFRHENTEFVVGKPTGRTKRRSLFVEWSELLADDFSFEQLESVEQASSAYFQAGLLVAYLHVGLESATDDRLDAYLTRVAEGENSKNAFEAVFAESADSMGARVYRRRNRLIKARAFPFRPGESDQHFVRSAVAAESIRNLLRDLMPEHR
jgi:hypothetical protein